MENQKHPEDPNNKTHKFTRGLYKGVKVSVKTLNIVIVAGLAVIVLLLVYGISTGGFHVTFHSRGGSDIDWQEYKYGETLQMPDDPTREGYTFTGWATDENCNLMVEEVTVESDLDLYACWAPVQ